MEKMFLICNAHIDPVWQWEWEEGLGAAISTFRVAAELCEKYETFVFNHDEAILYKWIEQYEPALFQKIQKLAEQGRWHIMGGWYLQPDCNMPSGESFVRQIFEGLTYFREKFGLRPSTAINFDPFGHTKGLVQIMQLAGYDSYIICRPAAHELRLERDQFIWKGFCNSELMVLRLPSYNTPLGEADTRIMDFMEKQKDLTNGVILWGVGNHGGGPSKVDLENITKLMEKTSDIEIIHSVPEQYFAELSKERENLPLVSSSLNPAMVGCYTSQIRIKQKNRRLESELIMAEKMASHASSAGLMKYPEEALKSAWEDLLFAQFHDILPGSSVQPVEDLGLGILEHGLQEVLKVKTEAFFKLSAGQVKAKDGELPILVYNPHPYRIKAPVDCEFMLADQNYKDEFIMPEVYSGEKKLRSQPEKELSNIPIQWRKRVVFEVELEPLTMNRYDIKLKTLPDKEKPELNAENGYFNFKGENIYVRINNETGLIDSYIVDGREFLKAGSMKVLAIRDNEDSWGMMVTGFKEKIGVFKIVDERKASTVCGVKSDGLSPVRVIEDGEVRTVIEAVFEYKDSQAVVRYYLPKTGQELKIQVRLIFVEKDTMLKLSIPTVFANGEYIGKTAYGSQTLATNGNEVVSKHWSMITDGEYALSCINTGNYGSSCEDGEVRISLMRTAAYCAHPIGERETVPQDRFTERIDQGERVFDFYINASSLNERRKKVELESSCVHEKPLAVCFFPPEGGERIKPLCSINNEVVQITAFKQAKDGRGYIVRLFNPDIIEQSAIIKFSSLNANTTQELKPYEIRTLRVFKGRVEITDLLEDLGCNCKGCEF